MIKFLKKIKTILKKNNQFLKKNMKSFYLVKDLLVLKNKRKNKIRINQIMMKNLLKKVMIRMFFRLDREILGIMKKI